MQGERESEALWDTTYASQPEFDAMLHTKNLEKDL